MLKFKINYNSVKDTTYLKIYEQQNKNKNFHAP